MHLLPMSGGQTRHVITLGQPFQAEFLDNVRCFDIACIDTDKYTSSYSSSRSNVATVRGDRTRRKERKKWLQRVGIASQNMTKLTFSRQTRNECNIKKHRRGPKHRQVIAQFIRDFGVHAADFDTTCISSLPSSSNCSEDDYFSRNLSTSNLTFLKKQLRHLLNRFVLFSPATCRTLFGPFAKLKATHIRGKRTTVGAILDRANVPIENKKRWFVLLSRLAPVDYHRVHSPVTGKILSIMTIKNRDAYSVDPQIVRNSAINVFVHNHRIVITIAILDMDVKRVLGPIVYVVSVGATCVNSIQLSNLRMHQILHVGDELAIFHYGGSTVLTLFVPPEPETVRNKTHMSLVTNLAYKYETYLEVGVPVLSKKIIHY